MTSEVLLNISESYLHDRQQFVAWDDESRLIHSYIGEFPKDQLLAHYYF